MNLTLERIIKSRTTCTGKLLINGAFQCWVCEGEDTGSALPVEPTVLNRLRVLRNIAVPVGHYELVMCWNVEHGMYLPRLLNVPGFEDVWMVGRSTHVGAGCIIVGEVTGPECVYNSGSAMRILAGRLKQAERYEPLNLKVCCNYTTSNTPAAWQSSGMN